MFNRINKLKFAISSVIILIPVLVAFFGGGLMPEEIAVHFGIDGEANGWMSPISAFIILPLIMLSIHWICMAVSSVLEKKAEQNKKVKEITYWIIPAISLVSCGSMFFVSIGYDFSVFSILNGFFGVMFIVIGNYLPKTMRNVAMGIKVKWTLSNDENWTATHRFAGKVFVCAGVMCLASILLDPGMLMLGVFAAVVVIAVLLPVIYSYIFYKKQLADGRATKDDYKKAYNEIKVIKNKSLTIVITVIVLAIVCVLMFLGNIETVVDDTQITVSSTFWSSTEIRLEDINSIEYREEGVDGTRINGIGSARLLVGVFKNDELGVYTRYTYNNGTPCIVLRTENRTVVIGSESAASVKELYDGIISKISE